MRIRLDDALMSVVLPVAGTAIALLTIELLKRSGYLPVTIPAPSQVWGSLLANAAGVGSAVVETVMNAVRGYAVACVVALGAAFIAALVAALRPAIYNLGVGLASVPLIAATPLLALWLGNGPLTAHSGYWVAGNTFPTTGSCSNFFVDVKFEM